MLTLIAVIFFLGFVLPVNYLGFYLLWERSRTRGVRYFALTAPQRLALKRRIRRHGRLLRPYVAILTQMFPLLRGFPIRRYRGVSFPLPLCSKTGLAEAVNYQPTAQDVFVATQVKCGTTWMQHIVYEVLSHGHGDLGDSGHRHLYAISPWIESRMGVSMQEAPLIGKSRRRLIKTHLDATLCPHHRDAKYIYVTRNPVSCLASFKDFLQLLTGPLCPADDTVREMFCSDAMIYRPWADHVASWWDMALKHHNVLFIHYEDIKADPRTAVLQVADLLGEQLDDEALQRIVRKISFEYMQPRADQFEMAPPNLFTETSSLGFFQRGDTRRYLDVSAADTNEVVLDCVNRLAGRAYPFAQYYPELLSSATPKTAPPEVAVPAVCCAQK